MRKTFLASAFFAACLLASPALAQQSQSGPIQSLYGNQNQSNLQEPGTEARTLNRSDQIWLDEDGQYRCRRRNGTTGLVIGAALGGFLGNRLAGRGNRTLGTVLGGVGGALLGRAIDRGQVKCQ